MTSRKRADQEPRDTFLVFHLHERVLSVSFNNRLTLVISLLFFHSYTSHAKTLSSEEVLEDVAPETRWTNWRQQWFALIGDERCNKGKHKLTTNSRYLLINRSILLSLEGMSTTRCAHPLLDVDRFPYLVTRTHGCEKLQLSTSSPLAIGLLAPRPECGR